MPSVPHADTAPQTRHTVERARRVGACLLALGIAVAGLGAWGLWRDVSWIAQPFYVWSWWGAILVMDGLVAMRRGGSLLTTRPRLAAHIALWSVTFWIFFELLNLRFQNWYYVGALRVETPLEALFGAAFVFGAFATVFTGIFAAYELLTSYGVLRRWRGRPRRWPAWVSPCVQALGAVMALLAIVFPTYLAPLVWGSLSLLLDPWNYRRGARSLLGDLERGDWGLVARVLLAGLACGVLWESLNFFAPQKWIYTVRGLEGLKLFEMPLLGFLGFPGLAVDAFAAFSFVSYWLLGNETWEHPADVDVPPRPRRRAPLAATLATLPLHAVFALQVVSAAFQVNVASLELRLDDLETLDVDSRLAAQGAGIRRPIQLLRAARDDGAAIALADRLGLSRSELDEVLDEAELFAFKGIGAHHGRLLRAAGVRRVSDLRAWTPEALHERLDALRVGPDAARYVDAYGFPALRLDMVRVWILAARSDGIVMVASGDE